MTSNVVESPKIVAIEWGRTEVQDLGPCKDCKLWPGGGREWDWGETGTRHLPGIQPADVQELIDHDAEVIVLSQGMELRLHTCRETLDLLAHLGIEVAVAETRAAVALYNGFASTRLAGCLIHSTC
jgi:hypothetical protein